VPRLEAEYIKTGKLKYVVREFPLEQIHPQAFKAAEAALCAGEQGKYWEMHERLFANQRALGPNDLPGHAQALGLDLPGFQSCLQGGKHAATVRKDLGDGQKAGVRGTPTFFLAVQEPNGQTVKVLRVLRGAVSFETFKATIDEILNTDKQ
jgi:protein-disulfide isomerase